MRPRIQIYARKRREGGLKRVLILAARLLAAAFVCYLVVTQLFLQSVRVGSVAMAPLLERGDALLVSPLVFGARLPFSASRLPGLHAPRRGELVLLGAPGVPDPGVAARLFDPLLRFFTLGRCTLTGGASARLMVKRIIGIPGDRVRMEGYRAWIKPAGSDSFVQENELMPGRYQALTGRKRDQWPAQIPFAGGAAEVLLGRDEYFVLGDNRPDSSDSRAWGPVGLARISGRVILRYLPLRRLRGL